MVNSPRSRSYLGMLSLVFGLGALVLTQFNPTGINVVHFGPITTDLAGAVGICSLATAMIAFLAAASSPKTNTGVPMLAVLVCGSAVALSYYPALPHFWTGPRVAPPASPAATPSQSPAEKVDPAAAPQSVPHTKTIFDPDFNPSTPTPPGKRAMPRTEDAHPPAIVPPRSISPSGPTAHVDRSATILAAQARLDAARAAVIQSLASSAAYQSAKQTSDQADADLREARQSYTPGSSELIAASKSAMDAHTAVQRLINDAASHDAAFQAAAVALSTAKASR